MKLIIILILIAAGLGYCAYPRTEAVSTKSGPEIGTIAFTYPILVVQKAEKPGEKSLHSNKLNDFPYSLESIEFGNACIGCQYNQDKIIAIIPANTSLTITDKWSEVPRGLNTIGGGRVDYFALQTPENGVVSASAVLIKHSQAPLLGNAQQITFYNKWLEQLASDQRVQIYIEFLPTTKDLPQARERAIAYLGKYGPVEDESKTDKEHLIVTVDHLALAGLMMSAGDLAIYRIARM